MRTRKNDPVSILYSFREKTVRPGPAPLTFIPPEENAVFQSLREALAASKLLAYLDKKEQCIDEELLAELYPDLDPLTDPLPEIDAYIYVYESMARRDVQTNGAKGDLRSFFGEGGFRRLFLELDRACRIHRFCAEHLTTSTVVVEPMTRKTIAEARKEAFAIHARAKEVFHQIALQISADMEEGDAPRVILDALRFAQRMAGILGPLAMLGRQVRAQTAGIRKPIAN